MGSADFGILRMRVRQSGAGGRDVRSCGAGIRERMLSGALAGARPEHWRQIWSCIAQRQGGWSTYARLVIDTGDRSRWQWCAGQQSRLESMA